jgi:hypothetical protein
MIKKIGKPSFQRRPTRDCSVFALSVPQERVVAASQPSTGGRSSLRTHVSEDIDPKKNKIENRNEIDTGQGDVWAVDVSLE